MKGPFFYDNLMKYYVLRGNESCFNDVNIAIDKLKLHYDVHIKEKIEVIDCYWIVANINAIYNICIECHNMTGLTIAGEDEQSNDIVTEIANYLSAYFIATS